MSSITIDAHTLAACNNEPIHIPGAIQPHGVLLVLQEPELKCLQVSVNIRNFCGWDPENILGKTLPEFAGEDALRIQAALTSEDPALESPISMRLNGTPFDCLLHRHDGVLIAELEPSSGTTLTNHHRRLQRVFATLRTTQDLSLLYKTMATFIAELTGYERVMVYRFDADWHGEVVGEHLSSNVDSYFGHHFPASDIPEQARALYARSWLRIIPDANYQAAAVQPPLNPLTNKPLDLSFSVLRSVSPIHLEYLRNMNVAASMSISLIVEGKLWGLIACHHHERRPLSYAIRAACEMFGQVASLEIGTQEEHRRLQQEAEATRIQTRFFDFIAEEQNFQEALVKYSPELLAFMAASGAALYVNNKLTLLGETPAEDDVQNVVNWLKDQNVDPLLVTDSLSSIYPAAAAFTENGSGLLALKLSLVEPNYLLWFRREFITTVTWAGNPSKKLEPGEILHPRKSFAAWQQTLRGRSLAWTGSERLGALELRAALNALVLRRTENLLALNAELEQKNTDLNSFAYIAAHDLREPLRGIANYSAFIQEDFAEELHPDAMKKLKTISALAVQSEELMDALSHFSRIGRMEVKLTQVSLEHVLEKALTSLEVVVKDPNVEIVSVSPLPTAKCDPVLIREVFFNLITNAIKYNINKLKRVEIGWGSSDKCTSDHVFYVKDNGIGIAAKHQEAIFHIFRRLHAHSSYGGGTGAGLAIVQSIIKRHGGRIWVDSTPGQGSTFYFTLA